MAHPFSLIRTLQVVGACFFKQRETSPIGSRTGRLPLRRDIVRGKPLWWIQPAQKQRRHFDHQPALAAVTKLAQRRLGQNLICRESAINLIVETREVSSCSIPVLQVPWLRIGTFRWAMMPGSVATTKITS